MEGFLTSITTWLLGLAKKLVGGLGDLIHDFALWCFSGVLDAIAAVATAIPVPSFIEHGLDLGVLFGGFPPFFFYLLGKMQIGAGVAILLSGISFRLLRKLFTLGQW